MLSKIFSILFSHNWIAVIYFNFKMLPFKHAIKLPFDFAAKIRFVNLSGSVEIRSSKIHRAMIKVGFQGSDMFPALTTVLDVRGKLIIGHNSSIGAGSLLRIERGGCVVIGNEVVVGAKGIIFCEKNITIKDRTITSWNCQIMDTDTHSIEDRTTGKIASRSSQVTIGENCWVGNNVIINKSVVLPSNTIVSSYSLCNKDYSKTILPFSVVGGIPAKVLAENKKRTGDKL